MFVGDYEGVLVRTNRLLLDTDTGIAQWPDLAKVPHELRVEAAKACLAATDADEEVRRGRLDAES